MPDSGVGQHLEYSLEQSVAGSEDRDHHGHLDHLRGVHRDEGRLDGDLVEDQLPGHLVGE